MIGRVVVIIGRGWNNFGNLIIGDRYKRGWKMDEFENRKHRSLKPIYQTNTSVHMQFAFFNFSRTYIRGFHLVARCYELIL